MWPPHHRQPVSVISLSITISTLLTYGQPLSDTTESETESVQAAFTEIPPNSPRIINGTEVPAARWPFVVSLQTRGVHFCGGTILTADAILTAAHCLTEKSITAAATVVYIGHVNKRWPNLNYLFRVRSFHVHPDFSDQAFNSSAVRALKDGHDVGVVKLAKPINLEGIPRHKVDKVCLPDGAGDEPIGERCIAIGWGQTSDDGKDSDQLREVALPLMPPGKCMPGLNTEALYCAGYEDGSKGICNGDSGGPLVCPPRSDPDHYVQYGVASFMKRGCASFGYFTKPVAYVEFIRSAAEGKG